MALHPAPAFGRARPRLRDIFPSGCKGAIVFEPATACDPSRRTGSVLTRKASTRQASVSVVPLRDLARKLFEPSGRIDPALCRSALLAHVIGHDARPSVVASGRRPRLRRHGSFRGALLVSVFLLERRHAWTKACEVGPGRQEQSTRGGS